MHGTTMRRAAALLAVVFIGGCGGGGGGDSGTGQLSLGLTDAPVDGVAEVWVQFTGVTVKPQSGPAIDFAFEAPLSVNLLALDETNTATLLNGEDVPAGEYNWIRLNVNAEFDGVMDSYVIEDGGGQIELRVPSGENSGLKLVSGFTVLAGGEASFVIDWNLRMGLVAPGGQPGYKLQPALRIVDMAEYGAVEGTVATALITDGSCTADPNTGEGNEVYVFSGSGVTPDDIDGVVPEPLATAQVRLDDTSGNYEYRAAFLPVGDYTVAFTCQAADDLVPDPDNPGADIDDAIAFTAGVDAAVGDGQTTTVNF